MDLDPRDPVPDTNNDMTRLWHILVHVDGVEEPVRFYSAHDLKDDATKLQKIAQKAADKDDPRCIYQVFAAENSPFYPKPPATKRLKREAR